VLNTCRKGSKNSSSIIKNKWVSLHIFTYLYFSIILQSSIVTTYYRGS
jgi:hypothetical protein